MDFGCGSGELTSELHRHLGAAETVGVDSSAAMLEPARSHAGEGLRFELGDLTTWSPPWAVDVILANASIQWVPDHASLLRRWRDLLRPGGQLAICVPANFDHPSHLLADLVGQRFGLEPLERVEAVLAPETYATLLDDLGFDQVHVRLQVYLHHLATTTSVLDWVQGTLLTSYRRRLDDDAFDAFLADYRSELLDALGDPAGTRPYVHAFKRILMTARLPA